MESMRKNPKFTSNSTPNIAMKINVVAADMTKKIMQKQQRYLASLFGTIGVHSSEKSKHNSKSEDKDFKTCAADVSKQTAQYFAEVTDIVTRTNDDICALLEEFCDTASDEPTGL
jgi:hypothetical protein